MYIYIDESGNTGNNLFDKNQPSLHYGVLNCRKNLDVVAEPMLDTLRKQLKVHRLHASKLGAGGIEPVAERFLAFQKRHDIRFDFYTVEKYDHAVISFFDQIFDAGLNEAVPWTAYWTPLRYVLLFKIAYLFDEGLARAAWEARRTQNREDCAKQLVSIFDELRLRLSAIPDQRSREIIVGALAWAQANPGEIDYGTSNRESELRISPNLVGFQSVLMGVSRRAKKWDRSVRAIVVDRQTEFNAAQIELNEMYRLMRDHKQSLGPRMPTMDLSALPDKDLDIRPGDESAGLEMVDVYLWIMKRMVAEKPVGKHAAKLLYGQRHRGRTDEVSLAGLNKRWRFLAELPEPEGEAAEIARQIISDGERKRIAALEGVDL